MNWRDSRGAAVALKPPMVPDSARLFRSHPKAIDLNERFHAELRAKRRNRGWGEDWTHCTECDRDPNCMNCGGEGGWPASATRFDGGEAE